MKKLCLLLMAVLIAAPFIYAEDNDYSIELDLDKNSVQVGDPILFEGSIFFILDFSTWLYMNKLVSITKINKNV